MKRLCERKSYVELDKTGKIMRSWGWAAIAAVAVILIAVIAVTALRARYSVRCQKASLSKNCLILVMLRIWKVCLIDVVCHKFFSWREKFDTSKVTSMKRMFCWCELPKVFSLSEKNLISVMLEIWNICLMGVHYQIISPLESILMSVML